MKLLTLTVAALVVCSPLLSAGIITVGQPASGSDFEEIDLAVDAAAPGDVILIAPGAYINSRGLEIDKPLTLIGGGSAVTRFTVTAGGSGFNKIPLYIHDLAAGEEVRVIGLDLRSVNLGLGGPTAALISDCEGPVVLADILGVGFVAAFGGPGVLLVLQSDQVLIDACFFSAGDTDDGSGPAMFIEESQVHVNTCTLIGATSFQGLQSGIAPDGTPAMVAIDSEVRLSNSVLEGGVGAQYFYLLALAFGPPNPDPNTIPGVGAPAIDAIRSSIFIRNGVATSLTGGAGHENSEPTPSIYSVGGAAIRLDADSLVSTTPGATLVPGLDGDGVSTTTDFEGSGVVVPLTVDLATLAITPSVASLGASLSIDRRGAIGGTYLTLFSLGQGPAIDVAGIPGIFVLPLASNFSLPVKALGASGSALLQLRVPIGSDLVGSSLLFQGVAVAPDGSLSFSSPSQLAIVQ